jgi:hypothetical protein
MIFRIAALAAFVFVAGLKAAGPPPPLYSAVEVDRFVAVPGTTFPVDDQTALADDIAREISLAFPVAIMVRQGDFTPYGQAVLRISGVVTRFKTFGGSTIVRAQLWFIDGTSGQVLLNREIKGTIGASLARKIVRICNSEHLVAPH